MSFSFSSLVRLLVLMAVGTTMLAVGVSRLDPAKPGWRTRRSVTQVNVNEYFLDAIDRSPRWLDVQTGRLEARPLSDGDVLEAAACSPWVDDKGRRQIIGRWASRTKDGPMSMSRDFGMARYSFPDGEMIDQVSTEIVPVGPPCWFPGTRARVLFTAGDGQLYHFAFEREPGPKDPAAAEPDHDVRPRQLDWKCPKPGVGDVFLNDLSWPDDPRLGGRLIVALREQEAAPEKSRHFSRTQLWWLKLNHAGTEIVEAGRLVAPAAGEKESDEFDERTPSVGTLPDGQLALAYLRQRAGENGWQLRVAPLHLEGDSRVPVALEAECRVIAGRFQPAHPAFSLDGRWLNVIIGANPTEGHVGRIAIADALQVASHP